MVKRIQLLKDVYMPLDGQPQIVLSGSVLDVADTFPVHSTTANTLSPGEPAGALKSHGQPTPVRTVRTK